MRRLALILGVGLVVAACATAESSRTPSARHTLAAPHIERAQAAEKDGRLREALESLQVALTIDPDDAALRAGLGTLQARIQGQVAVQLKEGRAALSRGAHAAARRHFLAALALDPGNRTAFETLRDQTQEVDVLSLNRLGARPPAPRGTQPAPPPAPPTPSSKDEPAEVNPIVAEAREALERRDYVLALADVDQLLASTPQNPEALALKKSVLYSQGKAQLEQRKYRDSLATLTQLARIAPNYEDSTALIRQTRTRLVEEHYNSGIRLYREEKVPEAIAEWKTVLEIDPQHVNARKNLEQSELLMKRLDERRK